MRDQCQMVKPKAISTIQKIFLSLDKFSIKADNKVDFWSLWNIKI